MLDVAGIVERFGKQSAAVMVRLVISFVVDGPVSWLANWHAKVWSALMFESRHGLPVRLRDVWPWSRRLLHPDSCFDVVFPPITESGLPQSFGDPKEKQPTHPAPPAWM